MTGNNFGVCPHCGGQVHKNAKACPHCGSDDETGWSENTYLDGIDLQNDESYDEIYNKEFGTKKANLPKMNFQTVIAILILIIFLFLLLRGLIL